MATASEKSSLYRPIAAAVGGIASGIALGAIVGPVGIALGAALGVTVGAVAGHVLHREDAKRTRRTRELDAIIGITNGSMGVGDVAIQFTEDAPLYTTREAWAAEWLTPPPPSVR
jgi:hypothetical protein